MNEAGAILMKYLSVAVCIGLSGCVAAPKTDLSLDAPVPWMVGCWMSGDGNSRGEWHAAGEGFMFGYGVTSRDGEPVFFEQERIESGNEGLSYFVYPMGGPPTRFDLAERTDVSVVFEAPTHDHPQRIAYSKSETGLTARISNLDGSRREEWHYRPCARSSKR